MSGIGLLACAGAVPGAHRNALAAGLHHDHVTPGQAGARVAGPLGAEIIGPGGEVPGQAGQLGLADLHPGAGLDDVLGLPVAACGQVIGGQGPHSQRVRVVRQDPLRVGGVQVGFAAVAVGQPGGPDRPEDAGHAPVVAFVDGAVPDSRGAGDLLDAHLLRAVDGEGRFQQPPLQLPARIRDHVLPVPMVQGRRLLRCPGQHRGELLHRAGQRRRQLLLQRAFGPVLADLPHRHRHRRCHRRASVACRGRFPSTVPDQVPEPADPATGHHRRRAPETRFHRSWPAQTTISDA